MKTCKKTNLVKMSLAAVLLLSTAAYAGKIVGVEANTPYVAEEPPKQYGFGGWNLDNVNVKITDLDFVEISKTFNETNGTYDAMVSGDSFESDILDSEGKVLGRLHGKDWPLGEPSGIKVVNNDHGTATSGKPANCIMTTSYLNEYEVHGDHGDYEILQNTEENGDDNVMTVSGLLNTTAETGPMPTICSSDFQTHKRFKVNMQPELLSGYNVESGYGKSFDLVFNLDTEDKASAVRRYQVFQKINNYTDMRLQGYKIEVLDENGSIDTDADLALSIKMTTKTTSDEGGTIATFSNGLWGPKDGENGGHHDEEELLSLLEKKTPVHFTENGFFDKARAGFTQEKVDDKTVLGGLPTLGSNYVDLFGIWLPSKWAPYGYFFDDDNNSKTDAVLVAYWGTTPDAEEGALPKWRKGNDYNETDDVEPFALVTSAELEAWESNPLYSVEKIEDTLNLGLNYVVEVGLNSTIGEKFTLRITPRVAPLEDQTPPSYIDENGDYILPPEVTEPPIGEAPVDPVANAGEDKTVVVNTPVTITGTGTDADGTIVSYEWKYQDTVIATTAEFEFIPTIAGVATLTLTVTDNDGLTGSDSMELTVTEEDGTVPDTPILSGGGGGCTYNPNSKNFDMMFLLMAALGGLYPFRRKFLK